MRGKGEKEGEGDGIGRLSSVSLKFTHILAPPSPSPLTSATVFSSQGRMVLKSISSQDTPNSSRAIAHTSLSTWTWVPYPTSVTSEPVGRGGEGRGREEEGERRGERRGVREG